MNEEPVTLEERTKECAKLHEALGEAFVELLKQDIELADFVTLDAVPTVEWEYSPANEDHGDQYKHGDWILRSAGAIGSNKRFVEVCIHLETIKRQLLAELSGVV